MSARTGISWTDRTWNPVVGCTKVSQGCKNCYAKTLHDQRHKALSEGKMQAPQYAQPFETVQLLPDRLTAPLSWRAPQRVFVNSVSDLFHEDVPFEYIVQVFGIMMISPRHTYQILTKRPQRMREFFAWLETFWPKLPHVYKLRAAQSEFFFGMKASLTRTHSNRVDREPFYGSDHTPWPLPNVWLGVSVENQAAADERIPLLLQTPASIRFLSCEPLLGPLDVSIYLEEEGYIDDEYVRPVDWVICGGESGKGARPMRLDWSRSLRDQCADNRVPFHFKQWGDYSPHCARVGAPAFAVLPNGRFATLDEAPHDLPGYPADSAVMYRVGTKRAGRELDGRTWGDFPEVRA